jgi:hypothetical protein
MLELYTRVNVTVCKGGEDEVTHLGRLDDEGKEERSASQNASRFSLCILAVMAGPMRQCCAVFGSARLSAVAKFERVPDAYFSQLSHH